MLKFLYWDFDLLLHLIIGNVLGGQTKDLTLQLRGIWKCASVTFKVDITSNAKPWKVWRKKLRSYVRYFKTMHSSMKNSNKKMSMNDALSSNVDFVKTSFNSIVTLSRFANLKTVHAPYSLITYIQTLMQFWLQYTTSISVWGRAQIGPKTKGDSVSEQNLKLV